MSTRQTVTCPSCGSLVPVGDRKCDNCGARQKDFAPAPTSYTRPAEPVVAPVPDSAPVLAAPAAPSSNPAPLAYRAPTAAAPGAHAVGVPSRAGAQPVSAYAAASSAPVRSRAASRALVFALIPVGVNVLGSVVLMLLVVTDLYDSEGAGEILFGLAVLLFLLVGGVGSLVLFILALVNGIRGVRETAGGALPGRGRAVWALVIVGIHVLVVAVNILISIVGALAGG